MKGLIVDAKPIPTGEYRLFCSNVEGVEGQFGPQVKFTFEVMDEGPHQHRELAAWASENWSTKSKLARWARALGKPFKAGEEFDTDCLIGQEAVGVILARTKEDGTEFNHIEDLKSADPFESE